MRWSPLGRALRLAAAAAVLGAACLRGADIESGLPAKPERYVTDQPDVLGPGGAERLNETLAQFERDTSDQILVWIGRRVPEGFTLEDFTVRAAQKWGAGQKKTDNGAILFVFTEDRKVRIEVGYGLEGAIPDVTAKRIIENEILPRFRAGDYRAGVEAGTEALMQAARGEYKGTGRTRGEQERRRSAPIGACLPWVIFFGIFFVLPWILRRRGFRTYSRRGWRSGGGFPTIFGGGGGGFSGGGGGSFGGFSGGGGSFGGGGASGSW